MLDLALLDLDMPVQDNMDSSIGPALATIEDISIFREEFYTLLHNSMKASNIFSISL